MENTYIFSGGGLRLGNGCRIGPGTVILTADHGLAVNGEPCLTQPLVHAPVVIGDGVELGACTVVTKGVTIGDRCIVRPHALVTMTLPADCVAAGSPARPQTREQHVR